jgi:DNA-directed RNA polymerase specialized sigma subunit
MLFDWFDGRKADQFGLEMAEYFAKRIPASSIPASETKPLRRAGEVISSLHQQLQRFRAENKLNIYTKAKLANAFQWKLFDLGYNKMIVEELTKELLRSL